MVEVFGACEHFVPNKSAEMSILDSLGGSALP